MSFGVELFSSAFRAIGRKFSSGGETAAKDVTEAAFKKDSYVAAAGRKVATDASSVSPEVAKVLKLYLGAGGAREEVLLKAIEKAQTPSELEFLLSVCNYVKAEGPFRAAIQKLENRSSSFEDAMALANKIDRFESQPEIVVKIKEVLGLPKPMLLMEKLKKTFHGYGSYHWESIHYRSKNLIAADVTKTAQNRAKTIDELAQALTYRGELYNGYGNVDYSPLAEMAKAEPDPFKIMDTLIKVKNLDYGTLKVVLDKLKTSGEVAKFENLYKSLPETSKRKVGNNYLIEDLAMWKRAALVDSEARQGLQELN